MSKRDKQPRKGRPGMLPPLGMDFESALGPPLRTPPPRKGDSGTTKGKKKKRRG